MSQSIKIPFSNPTVRQIVLAAYPGAKTRRPVGVSVQKSYGIWDFWDGGSRTYTAFVRLSDMSGVTSEALPQAARTTHGNPFGLAISKEDIQLDPGYAVVEHVIFCGKDIGYRIVLAEGHTLSASLPQLNA
jgi:hypothetical protein